MLSCIDVAVYATRYFLIPPNDDHFSRYLLPLRLHLAGGMGALLAGPWQFSDKLRTRALNFHRWLGRFYLLEVALGSIAGFVMATVRRGNTFAHRQWMIRNFALILAAVTLRDYMPLMLFAFGWSFRQSYITVSWLCWVPNLLVAEWPARCPQRQAHSVS